MYNIKICIYWRFDNFWQIFKYLLENKSTASWIQEIKKGSERNNTKTEEATERNVFSVKVLKIEGYQSMSEEKHAESGPKKTRNIV